MTTDRERPAGEDYLWDGGGPLDPEVAALEETLRPFRHRGAPPAWIAPRRPARRRWQLAAGIAALVVAVLTLARVLRPDTDWKLASLDGRAVVEGHATAAGARLHPGQEIATDDASRARLLLPRVGEVELGPGSRLRLVTDRRDAQVLALERGSLSARTWAPPKLFSIDTPAGRTVDYGCAYALDVDREGTTRLRVEIGWVALEIEGREAIVPAGAALRAAKGEPFGTPVWLDAPRDFRSAVETLDSSAPGDSARADRLAAVLAAARPRDALTLWHLLADGPEGERAQVFERLAGLAPPPPALDLQALRSARRKELRAWFAALGFGDVPAWN